MREKNKYRFDLLYFGCYKIGKTISGTWYCVKCGFTANGRTWNTKVLRTFQKFMLTGATYACSGCNQEVELAQGSGRFVKK